MTDFVSIIQLIAGFITAMGALKGDKQLVYSFSWWAMVLAMVVSIGYAIEGDILFSCIWIVIILFWKLIYQKAKKDFI